MLPPNPSAAGALGCGKKKRRRQEETPGSARVRLSPCRRPSSLGALFLADALIQRLVVDVPVGRVAAEGPEPVAVEAAGQLIRDAVVQDRLRVQGVRSGRPDTGHP